MPAQTLEIRSFRTDDRAAVIDLWHTVGITRPWNDPEKDIDRKLAEQPEFFYVAVMDEVVVGAAMAGFDGHRGWLHYLAVHPDHQRAGVGRALVRRAERDLEARGCPKVMLMVREGNAAVLAFYARLGYSPDAVAVAGKRLIPDR